MQLTSLTVHPGEAVHAGALIFIRSRVAAGSPVQTRLQRRTRVQICGTTTHRHFTSAHRTHVELCVCVCVCVCVCTFVTQLASIVGVTQTLPRFHTAAVNAAGMRDAPVPLTKKEKNSCPVV